jgi:sodium transport system permease protein
MDGALRTMLIQQIAIIASPALFMGIMLTTSIVRTFRFRLPRWDLLACAGLLAVALHPVSLELVASLHWFFPPLPPNVAQLLQGMTDPNQPLWKVLLVFAVAPGICEELAFRGFILSGFQHNGRRALAVVLSSLAFGVIHMIPQQVFNATLLGLVLGLIAIRTGSLLSCMVFHLIFNSMAVLHGRIAPELVGMAPNPFFHLSGGQLRYGWPTVLFAAVMAALLISRLIRRPDLRSEAPRTDRPALEVPQLTGNWGLSPTAPRPHP